MVWKGRSGSSSCWTELVQQWDAREVEALRLHGIMSGRIGPGLGDLHWREATGMGKTSRVLPEEAVGMLKVDRHAKRLREPGWGLEDGKG